MSHANFLTVGRALEKEVLSATILKNLELWASIVATNKGKFIHTCKLFSRSLCQVLMRKMGSRAGDWWKAADWGRQVSGTKPCLFPGPFSPTKQKLYVAEGRAGHSLAHGAQAKIQCLWRGAEVKSVCLKEKDRQSFARTQSKSPCCWGNVPNKNLYLRRRGRKPSWADDLAPDGVEVTG